MNKEEYQKIVDKYKPKEHRFQNALVAFLTGGSIGVLSELLSNLFVMWLSISKVVSYSIVCLVLIFIASFCTALGFFDNLVVKAKCGLIIPTTGFAHSVTSSALEFRKDGMITGLGANFFKLAGSVILYGIVSSFFLCLVKVIFGG